MSYFEIFFLLSENQVTHRKVPHTNVITMKIMLLLLLLRKYESNFYIALTQNVFTGADSFVRLKLSRNHSCVL